MDNLNNTKILIIEDQYTDLYEMACALETLEYNVNNIYPKINETEEYKNFSQKIANLAQNDFAELYDFVKETILQNSIDLIFCDLNLDKFEEIANNSIGISLIDKIKQDEKIKHIPIVVVSGFSQDNLENLHEDTFYINKPLSGLSEEAMVKYVKEHKLLEKIKNKVDENRTNKNVLIENIPNLTISNDFFMQKLELKNIANIVFDFLIEIDTNERKHLIITGKNGSGKTTTLREINNVFEQMTNNNYTDIETYIKDIKFYENQLEDLEQKVRQANDNKKIEDLEKLINNFKESQKETQQKINMLNINLIFSNNNIINSIQNGDFLFYFFEAKRYMKPEEKAFAEYMEKLKIEQAFAIQDENMEIIEKVDKWFEKFKEFLIKIFDKKDLKLIYNRKEKSPFKIEFLNNNNEIIKRGFDELSDGFSSILTIITELILRMETKGLGAYDMQGVVLIDEVETHLHVELQKEILPLLTTFFPKIQFIVTTHSPFVLSSLDNTVVCDLEKEFITKDLSAYSYGALIESYFDSDKYSNEIKSKIEQFEILSQKKELSADEKYEYDEIKIYFDKQPTFLSKELNIKINEIVSNSIHEKW